MMMKKKSEEVEYFILSLFIKKVDFFRFTNKKLTKECNWLYFVKEKSWKSEVHSPSPVKHFQLFEFPFFPEYFLGLQELLTEGNY